MPAVSKSLPRLPSSPMNMDQAQTKQGIVTILGSNNYDRPNIKSAASIRRTLSADMSSKKWLSQNGFFNKTSAADSSSSFDDHKNRPGQHKIWMSIQAQKHEHDDVHKQAEFQVWGSILTQKSDSNSTLPPPYVHPLVKRSASTLSEKSLEICTESLGSETGSDGFSSYPNSEFSSDPDDREERQRIVQDEFKEFGDLNVVKYKIAPARPFPPPLPSIAGGDGNSVYMQCHRKNGRLVVEAVSAPPRNCLRAQRGDGRLVLTFINSPASPENQETEDDDVYEDDEALEQNIEGNNVARKAEFFMDLKASSVQNSGLVMKKIKAFGNKNPTWSYKFNREIKTEAEDLMVEEEEEIPVPQSLPPRPPVARLPVPAAAAASFNAYEYFWRNKTTAGSVGFINLTVTTPQSRIVKNNYNYDNQDSAAMKGNEAENFVPSLRGCKEPRRSLLIWEPCCIATS